MNNGYDGKFQPGVDLGFMISIPVLFGLGI